MDYYKYSLRYQEFEEIGFILKRDLIQNVNIFHVDIRFTAYLFCHLFIYKVTKDILIYREGDPRDEIFIVIKG